MRRIAICSALILVLAVGAGAQQVDVSPPRTGDQPNVTEQPGGIGVQPAVTPFSLLDLSRVKWSHSYSISYFSGGGYSGSTGMLSSSMFYEFSPSLSMTLDLSLMHNAGALWGSGTNDARVLPGVRLDFHPSESFRMQVSFQQVALGPGYGSYYYRPYNWYGYSPYFRTF
jgi:hypothetical protein